MTEDDKLNMNRIVVSPGPDPRQNLTYKQLRDEMSKLLHPAVNWKKVEELCLLLFRHHGADLRSVVWFTAARLQRGGIPGLSEGLELLDTLMLRHWQALWPQITVSRLDALSWLATQVQHDLRRMTPDTQHYLALNSSLHSLRNITSTLQMAVFESVMAQIQRFLHNQTQVFTDCPERPSEPAVSQSGPERRLPATSGNAFTVQKVVTGFSAPFYCRRIWRAGWLVVGVLAGALILMGGMAG